MARQQTKGRCRYCNKEFTRTGIIRHLASCKVRAEKLPSDDKGQTTGYFELLLTGRYDRDYWLVIEMDERLDLADLDHFIRNIWVECCDHLSAFYIDGGSYDSAYGEVATWRENSHSMHTRLKKLLHVGQEFLYEYDFGSTTELLISVKDYRRGAKQQEKLSILARNNPPEILCSTCEKEAAAWVYMGHFDDDKPFICESCLEMRRQEESCDEEAEYFEDYLLPVCNSPRMGVCGYTGSEIYPD
ncbi:MAG: hypothetical protein QM296_08590 [Bacillota bacterium]|nr:hypothetical protein [Bacillota bacterium]